MAKSLDSNGWRARVRRFCQRGHGERLKAGVHLAMAAGAVGCGAYNAQAHCDREEPPAYLKWIAVYYVGSVVLELYLVRRHWRR